MHVSNLDFSDCMVNVSYLGWSDDAAVTGPCTVKTKSLAAEPEGGWGGDTHGQILRNNGKKEV